MNIFYNDRVVYFLRPIDKKNFNPMVWGLIDKGLLKDCVQIFVDVIGGKSWINVPMKELRFQQVR